MPLVGSSFAFILRSVDDHEATAEPGKRDGMQAIHPDTDNRRSGRAWGAPIEATAAVLEVIATEQPELLEFKAQALLNSTMSFALRELAAAFEVAPERVGEAVGRACYHLDRLQRHRRTWRPPAEVLHQGDKRNPLNVPNLSALLYFCRARLNRTSAPTRRHKFERILRRLEAADQLARTRVWIDDFIGPLPAKQKEAQRDVR